ncbi:MAG: thiopurine S-methyltransferase [Balneolaceae bacterium]|nr:thiopurine S-methyltransferase [Balneolaceae bacterium]
MEISYWKSRWNSENTGWHMQQVYPHLKTYWHRLELEADYSVLVPLCGKSLDLRWLAGQGHQVFGIEVSEIAVRQFFEETGLEWRERKKGPFTVYDSEKIQLWQGNFFDLRPSWLPPVDAIYDKAALIALPEEKRARYADLLLRFAADHTSILMNSFEYNPEEMNGPPFPVFEEELRRLFGGRFTLDLLHQESIFDRLTKFRRRGLSSYLVEKLYLLQPNDSEPPEFRDTNT